MKIFETIPLMIFLGYIRIIDTQIPGNWELPFIVSGLAAVIVIILYLYKKILLDRIFLGFNLYFISGGLAFITHQYWLNRIYGQLHASGLLLWVVVTGIFTIFFSSSGFIGVESSDTNSIKKYSYYLLFFSIIAFSLSFFCRGNRVFSELVPFISLYVLQSALKDKLVKNIQVK